MKFIKLYSNKPNVFKKIIFNEKGLNIIFADVHESTKKDKHTHNLGKSLIIELLDFMLLKKKNRDNVFIFKHYDLFKFFTFFLEIKTNKGLYITIKREIRNNSKISIKKSQNSNNDFVTLPDTEWDHLAINIDRAIVLLDSMFGFTALEKMQNTKWSYRNGLPYFLRTQDDYINTFELPKLKGKHSTWKPYLFHLLGFNGNIIQEKYDLENEINALKNKADLIVNEFQDNNNSESQIRQKIYSTDTRVKEQEKWLDKFNLYFKENDIQEELMYETEEKILYLNNQKYTYLHEKKNLEEQIGSANAEFNIDEIKQIYEEAGVYFKSQLKRDYQDLIEFNKIMTADRNKLFEKQLQEVIEKIAITNKKLEKLNEKREAYLDFLGDSDTVKKYKFAQKQLIEDKTNLAILKEKLKFYEKKKKIELEIKSYENELSSLCTKIEISLHNRNPIFDEIQKIFSDVIRLVLGQIAICDVIINRKKNIDFNAEFTNEDASISSKNRGNSYKRLLCVAFDLAVIVTYSKKNMDYFRFALHDGVLEGLDDRVKIQLINLVRKYCKDFDFQYIFTMISSDMPAFSQDLICKEDEIIKKLHDKGQDGRLFQMEEF